MTKEVPMAEIKNGRLAHFQKYFSRKRAQRAQGIWGSFVFFACFCGYKFYSFAVMASNWTGETPVPLPAKVGRASRLPGRARSASGVLG